MPIFLPLRVRKEIFPDLVEHFLQKYHKHDKSRQACRAAVMKRFLDYRWEEMCVGLESVIERSVILADHDVIDLDTLPQKLQGRLRRLTLPIAPLDFTIPDEGISRNIWNAV